MHLPRKDPWLLLLHQIPPKPNSFRVKIWRRLQRLGAVAIKNAAYVLPNREEAREDFERLAREIIDSGGDAVLCEIRLASGLSDEQVETRFREARDADYREVAEEARARTQSLSDPAKSAGRQTGAASQIKRLRKRFTEIAAIDFFTVPGSPPD